MIKRSVLFLLMAIGLTVFISFNAFPRELSKAGQIYQDVKDGVVTIIGLTHGSGFLIDEAGLIITNCHVVNDSGETVRVRFGADEVVKGKVVLKDREADVAIVWVNLENIKHFKVLEAFHPQDDEPLVIVGEKVVAVGSPVQWETLEKTMTEGVTGKYENEIIRHDASINGGNSGGPLFNFDGQVVGINTFGKWDRGPAIGGAIAINKALPILQHARESIKTIEKPSSALLADIPKIPYPIERIVNSGQEKEKEKSRRNYTFDSTYFLVNVVTPPQGYRSLMKQEELLLEKRKKRAAKKGFEISDDELQSKETPFWDYKKPVVTLHVLPKPKLTTGSKITNTLVFLGAVTASAATYGAAAPMMVAPTYMGKREVKKDFLSLKLHSKESELVCTPYLSTRQPLPLEYVNLLQTASASVYQELIDKTYVGLYEFDAKCFDTADPLVITIEVEGSTDHAIDIEVPQKIKDYVVDDFKPYWMLLSELEPATSSEAQESLKQPTQAEKDLDALHRIINGNGEQPLSPLENNISAPPSEPEPLQKLDKS